MVTLQGNANRDVHLQQSFLTGLQPPDGEDWRVFWNKPEEVAHVNYQLHVNYFDNTAQKPAGKNKQVVAGRESYGEVSRRPPAPTLSQHLESHWLLATNLRMVSLVTMCCLFVITHLINGHLLLQHIQNKQSISKQPG